MQVRSIYMRGFMRHAVGGTFTLPERGVVLVTGANGAGKSSIIEAVATGLWGKTVRGTLPWREGTEGRVIVATDRGTATRSRSVEGKTTLAWTDRDGSSEKWENTQKAQAAVAAQVGAWEVWRRTCVFTASDAAHFSLASDGERKRLLEALLGLHRFDAALEACRADSKEVRARLATANARMATAAGAAEVAQANVHRAREEAREAQAQPLPPVRDRARLEAMLREANQEARSMRGTLEALASKCHTQRALVRHLATRAERLAAGECSTCGQTIPADALATQREELDAESQTLAALEAEVETERGRICTLLEEVEEEAATLADHARDAARAEAVATERARAVQRSARWLADAEAALEEHRQVLARVSVEAAELAARAATLEAVDTVLGLRGVRAHVLGRALAGVETVANGWLSRIAGPNLRLRLRPYAEKADGSVSDAIGLEVEGAGGGHGYRAASTGERRRIDVALLFALSEVAAAAAGEEPGTLWVDEVFDGLDTPGVQAVSVALAALSASRAVCVITHNPALVALLPNAQQVSL